METAAGAAMGGVFGILIAAVAGLVIGAMLLLFPYRLIRSKR